MRKSGPVFLKSIGSRVHGRKAVATQASSVTVAGRIRAASGPASPSLRGSDRRRSASPACDRRRECPARPLAAGPRGPACRRCVQTRVREGARRASGRARMLAKTRSKRPGRLAERMAGAGRHIEGETRSDAVQPGIGAGHLDRDRVDVTRDDARPQRPRGREGQDAGARADIHHPAGPSPLQLGGERREAAARRAVMPRAEGERGLDLDREVVRRAPSRDRARRGRGSARSAPARGHRASCGPSRRLQEVRKTPLSTRAADDRSG